MLTFVPPFAFALLYPEGFVLALGYAAIFATILIVILPALMVYKLRRNTKLTSSYRVGGGTPLLLIVLLAGIILVGIQIFR